MLSDLRSQNNGIDPRSLNQGLNPGGGGVARGPVAANQHERPNQILDKFQRVQNLGVNATKGQASTPTGAALSIPSIETLTKNSELFNAAYEACSQAAKEGKSKTDINKLIDTKVARTGLLGSSGISLGEAALLKIIYGTGVLKATSACNEKKALKDLADSVPGGAASILLEVCEIGSSDSVKNFSLSLSPEYKSAVVKLLAARANCLRDSIERDKKNVARGAEQQLNDATRTALTQSTQSWLLNAAELADSIPSTSDLKISTCAMVFMAMTPAEREIFINNGSDVRAQAGDATEQDLRRDLVEYEFPRLLVEYEKNLRGNVQVQNIAMTALGLEGSRVPANSVADSLAKEIVSLAPAPGYKILLDKTTPLEKQQRLQLLQRDGLTASAFTSYLPEGKDAANSTEKAKLVDMLIKQATTTTLLSFDPKERRLSPKEAAQRHNALTNGRNAHNQVRWRELDAKPAHDAALAADFNNPGGAKFVELTGLLGKYFPSTPEKNRIKELQKEQGYVNRMRTAGEEAEYVAMRTLEEENELVALVARTRTPLQEAEIRAINSPTGTFQAVDHSTLNANDPLLEDAANTAARNRTEIQEIEHAVFERQRVLQRLGANNPAQNDATNTAARNRTKAEEAELALINRQYSGLTILTPDERLYCQEIAEEIVMSDQHLLEKERIAILLKWENSGNPTLQALALKGYQKHYKESDPDTSKLVLTPQEVQTLQALQGRARLMARPVARTVHNNIGVPLYHWVVSPILAIWNNKGRIAKAVMVGGLLLSNATPLIPSQGVTFPTLDFSLNTGMQIATSPALWTGAGCAGATDMLGGNPYLSATAGAVCAIGRDYFQDDGYIQSYWNPGGTTKTQNSNGVRLSPEAEQTLKLQQKITENEVEISRLQGLNPEEGSREKIAIALSLAELMKKTNEYKNTVNEYYTSIGVQAPYK